MFSCLILENIQCDNDIYMIQPNSYKPDYNRRYETNIHLCLQRNYYNMAVLILKISDM
jgi:hypothetical protein